MKIGILTFINEINYGCSLQAFALQQAVKKIKPDCECYIIDYTRNRYRDSAVWIIRKMEYKLLKKDDTPSWTLKEFVSIIREMNVTNTCCADTVKLFRKFWKKNLYTEHVGRTNIRKLNKEMDLFIVGSDQVWNCGCLNIDKTFLLDFVNDNQKKGSYAASLGLDRVPAKYANLYRRYLSEFHYLSCREKTGKDVIERLINKEVGVCADPTFLLSKNEWKDITKSIGSIEEDYILVFAMETSSELRQFAENISKQTNYPLFYINSDLTCSDNRAIGPLDFVKLISNAKCVITSSFHGMAFAINLEVDFYVQIAESEYMKSVSSRISDLIDTLGLQNRCFNSNTKEKKYEHIDYDSVNGKKDAWVEKSRKYLENMINGIEETR